MLLCNILERDLYLSLQLADGDGFLAAVDKVKGVFDGLCNFFYEESGVHEGEKATRRDKLGAL